MKKVSYLLLAIFIFCTSVANAQLSKKEEKLFNDALEYASASNNRKAISILRHLYEKHDDDIDVTYNLGLCYMNSSGNPDSALYFLQKTVSLDAGSEWTNDRSELYLAIARTQQLRLQFDEARKIYDMVEEKDVEKIWAEDISYNREVCDNAKTFMAQPVKLTVKNLETVNSEYNDYRPVISIDGQTLIFTSRRKTSRGEKSEFDDGQFEESVYSSKNNGNGWSKPELIEGLFDSKGQATVTCLTNEGRDLYIVRDGNIYLSQLDSATQKWQKAQKLPSPINQSNSQEIFASVTEDGNEMFFVSNRKDGYGGYDIYHSYKLPNGLWGIPLNVGSTINTPYDEDAPIKHPTNNILYFSSQGHNTMGGYDIFYSIENNDSIFEAVRNIGFPINTPDDDIYFVPTAQKNMAYYASIKWSGTVTKGYDIYEVEYDEPEIDKLAIISGQIKAPDITAIRVTTMRDGEIIGRYIPNAETGRFIIIVEAGDSYTIVASNLDTDESKSKHITTLKTDSYSKLGNSIDIGILDFRPPEPISEANEEEAGNGQGNASAASATTSDNNKTAQAKSPAGQTAQSSQGGKYYTVQFLSLRKQCDLNIITTIPDKENIYEYAYRDGWFVYSYGKFDSVSAASQALADISSNEEFADAFIRNAEQYERFVK